MAKEFKVKYATRVKLQRAIQQQIKDRELLDTRTMVESIRISSTTGDLNTLYITVNAIYYYVFHDRGYTLRDGTKMKAQNMTRDALNSSLGRQFQEECVQAYIDWMVKNYPILDVGRITVDKLKVKYRYNVFGGEEYGYSGFYPNNDWFKD
jgi:hypothetical protein